MTNVFADFFILAFLLAGTVFGAIALMGLLIFPDIRSRRYTAFRAGLISCAATSGAAVIYTLALFFETGGSQYVTYLFSTILLAGIIVVGTMIINRQVLEKTQGYVQCAKKDPAVQEPGH